MDGAISCGAKERPKSEELLALARGARRTAGAWHVIPRPDLADVIKEGKRWCGLAAHVS